MVQNELHIDAGAFPGRSAESTLSYLSAVRC